METSGSVDKEPQATVKSYQYRVAPGVQWVVERDGLILTNGHGATWTIKYPDAAVWDLVSRSYDFGRAVWMMRYIAGVNEEGSRQIVCEALERWTAAGLLTKKELHG